MSSSLIPFSFDSHEVRAFNIEGNPWFVGKDVAEVLGYQDSLRALKQHCKGAAKYHPLQTPGGVQEVRVINEPDAYRLITGSTLPEAARFETWLFEEVLPSIRKTGGYSLPGTPSQPLDVAVLAQQLADLLKGKVVVDYDTLENLTRLHWTVQKLAEPLIPLALKLEQQCGKPLIQDLINDLTVLEALEKQPPIPRQPIQHGRYRRGPLEESLLDFIITQKQNGAGHRALQQYCRAYRSATDQERETALNLLLDQGVIFQVQPPSKPGARRKAVVYVARQFVKEMA